jgi:hypothetical protein
MVRNYNYISGVILIQGVIDCVDLSAVQFKQKAKKLAFIAYPLSMQQ